MCSVEVILITFRLCGLLSVLYLGNMKGITHALFNDHFPGKAGLAGCTLDNKAC